MTPTDRARLRTLAATSPGGLLAEAARTAIPALLDRVDELEAALRDIATSRPYVDMADPQEDQERDALHALCRLHERARTALASPPPTEETPK